MSQSYRVILKHFKTFPAAKNNWGIGVRKNEEKRLTENTSGIQHRTNSSTARWPLRHAAIPDNYRLSQKLSILAGKMYQTICVEWVGDYFDLGLT